ncbi:MAG: hypothetical protein WBE72_23630 [Terracidiphilus sp.]
MEIRERTLEEKLKDANSALRTARYELGRAIQQRDSANGFVATRRVKVDQLEAWLANLQADFDTRPIPVATGEEDSSSTGE